MKYFSFKVTYQDRYRIYYFYGKNEGDAADRLRDYLSTALPYHFQVELIDDRPVQGE